MVDTLRMEMPRLGTRKLYHLLKDSLQEEKIKLGRDALFALLRSRRMLVQPKKGYTKTTDSKHWLKKHPNWAAQFTPTGPEQLFVSDITYVKSKQRVHYLSLVTDAYSRKIMGFQLSDDLGAEATTKAMTMALKNRVTDVALIHHSDRGIQYCSRVYQEVLKKAGVTPSMTDGYDCYQNAMAERINGILKDEFLVFQTNTGHELNNLIEESINTYNVKRPHTSLGMKTPEQIHKEAYNL